MSFLQHALNLAEKGFYVFPILANTKDQPLVKFKAEATRDAEKIKKWWLDPVLEIERDHNIGVFTGKFGDDEALVVVDVDTKEGKKGADTLLALEFEGKILPETYTTLTASGGFHFFYRVPSPLKQGTSVLGEHIDVRSKGGYVVASGSTIDGKEYKAIENEIVDAPQWVVETCGKAKEKEEVKVDAGEIDQDTATTRAIEYLSAAEGAMEGDAGDSRTFAVACKVKDFGVTNPVVAFELMADYWNHKCQPPWSLDDLQVKVENAYRYGTEPVGASAPETQFEAVEEKSEEVVHYLHKMNEEYALVYMEGSHFILHETIDEKGNSKRVFLTEQTFKRKFSPFTLEKKTTYATEWLDWKGRREYVGVCFTPEREARNGYYNLWRGFTCGPLPYEQGTDEQRKGFDAFITHARENICQGDENLFNWLMGYFAHLVQRPWERPLTTLVFRGGKGTGKNALIDRVGHLLGNGHYLVAHNRRYLTSNFNGHMDSCLCLVLDEAFWSGDKDAEGQLKGLTTGPEILIERKGKEPYMVDNLVRLVIIGNEDWLVPASTDERRYAVYDVGDGKKQNRQFFHDMRVNLDEKGGNRILLDYLKNFDLSTVDVNAAPKTQALLDQKIESLEPFDQWWFGCLEAGRIGDFDDSWPVEVAKGDFRHAFFRYCTDRRIKSRLPDDRSIGRLLKKVCDYKSTNKRDGEGFQKVYRLPTLEECRGQFEKTVGQEVKWESAQ